MCATIQGSFYFPSNPYEKSNKKKGSSGDPTLSWGTFSVVHQQGPMYQPSESTSNPAMCSAGFSLSIDPATFAAWISNNLLLCPSWARVVTQDVGGSGGCCLPTGRSSHFLLRQTFVPHSCRRSQKPTSHMRTAPPRARLFFRNVMDRSEGTPSCQIKDGPSNVDSKGPRSKPGSTERH